MKLKGSEDLPVVLDEDSRGAMEQLPQAALGTVHMDEVVDIVDVLDRGSEIGPL